MDLETEITIAIAFGVVFGAMFWAFHASLFIWFLSLARHKLIKQTIRLACIAGFVLSTATLAVYMFHMFNTLSIGYGDYYGLHATGNTIPVLVSRVRLTFRWLYLASMLISDSVQVWRCLSIWGRSRLVLSILPPLWFISAASGLIFCCIASWSGVLKKLPHDVGLTSSVTDVMNIAASLALNVCATCLMAYKIKQHTRDVRRDFGPNHRHLKQFEFLSALLIESGVFYTISQAWYFMCHNISFNLTSWDPTKHAVGQMGCVVQILSCLYPVSVILFAEVSKNIAARYSSEDHLSTSRMVGLPTTRASTTRNGESGTGHHNVSLKFRVDTATHEDSISSSRLFTGTNLGDVRSKSSNGEISQVYVSNDEGSHEASNAKREVGWKLPAQSSSDEIELVERSK